MNQKELELLKTNRVQFLVPLHVSLTRYEDVKFVDDLLKFYPKKKDMVMDGIRTLHYLKKIHITYPNGMNWKQFKEWCLKALENTMRKKAGRNDIHTKTNTSGTL
jgi:hypothetical protein